MSNPADEEVLVGRLTRVAVAQKVEGVSNGRSTSIHSPEDPT